MNCPACQISMVVIEFNGIELDYCVECMGVWFDGGEIELLMDKLGVSKAVGLKLRSPSKVVTEAKRRCPLCDKLMTKVSPAGSEVVLDQCPDGDGLWFDAGELRQALMDVWRSDEQNDGKDLDQMLRSFLGDFFSTRCESE